MNILPGIIITPRIVCGDDLPQVIRDKVDAAMAEVECGMAYRQSILDWYWSHWWPVRLWLRMTDQRVRWLASIDTLSTN